MSLTAVVRSPLVLAPPTVGDRFPDLALPGSTGATHRTVPESSGGKWLLVLYWPRDFAQPDGLGELRRHPVLTGGGVQALGVSSADHPVDAGPFPILADARRELGRALGLPMGGALRASYLVDPEGIIRWASLEDLPAPRPLAAALRTLDAAPCPEPHASARSLECMCAWCRHVQAADGRWEPIEAFVRARLPVEFSHGICPACLGELERSMRARTQKKAQPCPEARRSARVGLRVRIVLDAEGNPHPAETAAVNRHGALVLSPVPHREQAELVLSNLQSGDTARCRVVWCSGESPSGQHTLGIELLEDRPEFWGPEYQAERDRA
ncbi:MAG TPA: redoxin domain-containing protein [Vicinamibacteria bacterium]|nr:redoxin domain-containing protein [Vicinamibacteria bacterium]